MSKKRLRPAPVKTPVPTTNRTIEPDPAAAVIETLAAAPAAYPASSDPASVAEGTPAASAAIAAIENALAAVRELSAQRLAAKLSVSRLMGVARELKELLKVMSVYGV